MAKLKDALRKYYSYAREEPILKPLLYMSKNIKPDFSLTFLLHAACSITLRHVTADIANNERV